MIGILSAASEVRPSSAQDGIVQRKTIFLALSRLQSLYPRRQMLEYDQYRRKMLPKFLEQLGLEYTYTKSNLYDQINT